MRELKIVLVLAVVFAPAVLLLAQSLPSGVHTHLDASDPLNNGGNTAGLEGTTVATWTDISGNARAFSAIGDPTWSATSGPNGSPAFTFPSGTGQYYDSDDPAGTWSFINNGGGFSAFVVAEQGPEELMCFACTADFSTAGLGWSFAIDARNRVGDFGNLSSFVGGVQGTGIATTSSQFGPLGETDVRNAPHIFHTVWGGDGQNINVGADGVILHDVAPKQNGIDSDPIATMRLGEFHNIPFSMAGTISELLLFDSALSEEEVMDVGLLLADKYDLTFVPEPATLGLFVLGALSILNRRRSAADAKLRVTSAE